MANGIEFNQNTASVFNSNSLDFELESQQLTQKNSSNSYSPLLNLQNELAMITSSSLSETIEGLSLGYRKGSARKEEEGTTTEKLLNDMQELLTLTDSDKLKELSLKNSGLLEQHDPNLAMFGNMPKGEIVALISSLLQSKFVKIELKKKYAKLLLDLLGEDDWELALLSWLGVGELNQESIQKIKKLYEKAKDEDSEKGASLLDWFMEIKDLPEREKHLKVIIRALSFDLSYMSSFEDKVKTSSIISDLCRVIIFLSLDNYTDIIAISINKDKDVILNEVLSIIEHVWLTEDWLLESPSRVSIVEDKHVYYFHLLKDFFASLPDACFIDREQRDNTLLMIGKVIDYKEDVI
ncbi:type III secretion system LEE gatekeeper SepL [Escherichia coli]|uniref:type III secretion system LEE gatekeeper SepL n=1 Tax=Escherichia coli TaxID=562 RepID=UPI0010ACFFD9|nr:type III secretion system LEE gatekeeper SepL [Escherichia coli]TJB28687.1 TyeA family type III secretion system gatekeeper subunit [Escherichia coli]TJB38976.1 TyeA family type III secretion system gatekeeper subunit [Escherichia coli]HAN1404020.1 type III secretion system LEE gatekeeper SepL [Escherichia coli]HAN1422521.1 type III secretion system LEE gatekeeper SepL [Escherichia coli]